MANYCVGCGYKVEANWNYCPNCGERLPELIDNKNIKLTKYPKIQNGSNLTNFSTNNECKKPTLPRKVDRVILEGRLEEYRLAEKERQNLPAYCIFNNETIKYIVEKRNEILTKYDLLKIKGLGDSKISKYGDDIINLLNELDQNYIP